VTVQVRDTGPGIPEDIIGKIFEPYFTTKDFSSGLGLTVVYKIVKEHSGEVSVSSRAGEGTTFTLTFPIPQGARRLIAWEGNDKE
jgi:signal transduction histidine kinase